MPRPNEVGAIWKRTNDKGEDYLSIKIEMETLLELTNGAVSQVHIHAYPIVSQNPKAPSYQLKYYPPRPSEAVARPPQRPQPRLPMPATPGPDDDDDIPF